LLFVPPFLEPLGILLHNQIFFKFYYFGLGVIMYQYEKYISTFNLLVALIIGFTGWFVFNIQLFFLPLFVVSFVFLIAFRIPKIDMSRFGDLSYGLYIFHFPLIQLFVYNDWLIGLFYIDFIIVITVLLILSRFSWLYIENKAIIYGKS
jgi:peptidoglycan/LPS O-acetylase OafA/YrhL